MWVYILTNESMRPFYVGVARSLVRRVWEHKNGIKCDYTTRYNLHKLVYYERWHNPRAAIAREKQLKGITRLKKIQLVVSMNPTWKDLSEGWYDHIPTAFRAPAEPVDPSLRSG